MRGRLVLLGMLAACGVAVFVPAQPGPAQWSVIVGGMLLGAALLACLARCVWHPNGQARWPGIAPVPTAFAAWLRIGAWALLAAAAMLILTASRIWLRLEDQLAAQNIDRVSRVELRVVGLPVLQPDGSRFEAEVIAATPTGVPRRIMVSWRAPGWQGPYGGASVAQHVLPEILPGQVWRMALTLRPVAGQRNPHAFDYEGHAFAQGIRASGTVRGEPRLLRDAPYASLEVVAQRVRHRVREAMMPYLQGSREGAILLALAIGDQAAVAADDWIVFNRTGITHLVSISGSHITMIAALGGLSMLWLWRRLRWGGRLAAERMPAQLAAAWTALAVAWLYCLLAGWGVPARRTFLMLGVLAVAYLVRLPLSASRLLLLTACVVVILDPWALMASGFWLSFGAVAVLMCAAGRQEDNGMAKAADANLPLQGKGRRSNADAVPQVPLSRSTDAPGLGPTRSGRPSGWQRFLQSLPAAARLQLAISFALMPLLARLFHEVSLVSPLANAYAIPVIGLLVTPLALLLALFASLPGMALAAQATSWLGQQILSGMLLPTDWLAQAPLASLAVPAVPWALTLLAVAGVAAAMLPGGWRRWRRLGWLLMLPALLWRPQPPAHGAWRLTVLDTGQSGAAVLQTHRHVLLFDAGLRSSQAYDSGTRTVAPFLRSQGIRRLDAMVLSHADLDHAGGASGVLRALPVVQAYSSFDLPAFLRREARLLERPQDLPPMPQSHAPCVHGRQWQVDGVSFQFLWPLPASSLDADAAVQPGAGGDGGRGTVQAAVPAVGTAGRNAGSCVLLVRGAWHSVLFTGDIGVAQEQALVRRGLAPVDVVLAPHHGSRHASSPPFVQATQPAHAIAQAGLWNRFGHPHVQAEQRWKRGGAAMWRTDLDGAITVASHAEGLAVQAQRETHGRYWQLACQVRQACDVSP